MIANPRSSFTLDGMLIGWRVYAGCSPCRLNLQVWRPTTGANKYQLIADKFYRPPATATYQFIQLLENEFVRVLAGDVIGMSWDDASVPFDFTSYGTNKHCQGSADQSILVSGSFVPGDIAQLAVLNQGKCRTYSFNAVLL